MTTSAATIAPGSSLGFTTGITMSLEVKDLERSKGWYQDVLGFRFIYEIAEISWCELETPTKGVNIGLSQVEEVKAGGGLVPTFYVTDIEITRANLEARHVRFDGPTNTMPGLVKLATFFDPDGHPFMLAQNLANQG
jgi:catechol 2,3-dioxygenase-like lactoylglutathione lyase family enzyme